METAAIFLDWEFYYEGKYLGLITWFSVIKNKKKLSIVKSEE